jgi:DNA-directed RNA polymerase subunit RPC12/RpoP
MTNKKSHLIVKLSEKRNRRIFYHPIIVSRVLSICPFNSYKALDRSLLSSERNREEEEERTNKKISYLCSKCGKTFAGKQSALNHAKDYHKSKNSKEFVDQLMQEDW